MEIFIILLLVLVNGLFAMSELAVISSRKGKLQTWVVEGKAGAAAALHLLENPNRFLSTVQVGITLIGILAGAFGGAALGGQIAEGVARVDALEPYAEALGFALVVLLTTYLSLVLGELVPKRLAMQNPEGLACRVAPLMLRLSQLTAPIVAILSLSTRIILRALGMSTTNNSSISEAEILALLQEGLEEGVFIGMERDMVEGVFDLDASRAGEMMTPRLDITWLDVNDSPDKIRDKILKHTYSFYPVCDGNLDRIRGILRTKDWLRAWLQHHEPDIVALAHRPLFVPTSVLGSRLLEQFKVSGTHVAVVVDEFGGVEGIVTLTDILEEIVGDMDDRDPEAVQREDGSWLIDGMYPVDELQDLLPELDLPEDEESDYVTLGGFVLARLGHIPKAADHFQWTGYRFEVVDMDDKRVDKVLVQAIDAE